MSSAEIEKIRLQGVLKRYGFSFKKKYGQNFITDLSILEDIADAAELCSDDFVLEIGPGMGTLTRVLAKRSKGVLAIEIDDSLKDILEEELSGCSNVEVMYADVMKLPLKEVVKEKAMGQSVKVVANLPYYITTPIIMMLLEGDMDFESITVMVQKEVAERMTASPGTKAYGAITLAVDYYTKPDISFVLSANTFYPPPKVESAVVCLKRHKLPPVKALDEGFMFEIIRKTFSQRRKTLVNAIYNQVSLDCDKDELIGVIEDLGYLRTVRGETLSLEEFATISNKLLSLKKGDET